LENLAVYGMTTGFETLRYDVQAQVHQIASPRIRIKLYSQSEFANIWLIPTRLAVAQVAAPVETPNAIMNPARRETEIAY